jgi:hypothetical protein
VSTRPIGVMILMSAACSDTAILVSAPDASSAEVDASTEEADAGASDSAPQYGASCMGTCSGGLTCFTSVGPAGTGHDLANGLCTKPCQHPADCPAASAQCAMLHGSPFCLAACNPFAGIDCLPGYACCANSQIVSGPGVCAPHWSILCKINGD